MTGPVSRWEVRATETLARRRAEAVAGAEAVLGPLAPLADTTRHGELTAATLVEPHCHSGRPSAVLQLVADHTGVLDDGSRVGGTTVWRRLTWTTGLGDLHEHVSIATLPRSAPDRLDPALGRYWQQLPRIASLVLPDELRELLLACDEDHPARLLVVPTGLMSVTFDALPLRGNVPPLVGQRAATVVAQSLSTAAALAQDGRAEHVGLDERSMRLSNGLSVYDLELPAAQAEQEALVAALQDVVPMKTLEELRTALTGGATAWDVLAMAVHGADDAEGWGQTKRLPDGSELTAADLLGWNVPRLCVLASCWSSIRQRRGGELAGFPLAMLLSGARTVIGSVIAVNDEATGQIMERFWPLLCAGAAPADALFHARRQWLTPERLQARELWAGLIVYSHL